ncbi:MAG: polysaccharide deacetylase family protein [Oscillospiraceae bacterium]|nr:polysaccharide deacetylase family protein [Oscillospiraceae bacterium]
MDNNNKDRELFDFEEWDVEKILQQYREQEEQKQEREIPQQPVQPVYQPTPAQRNRPQQVARSEHSSAPAQRRNTQRPADRNRRRKKKRVNWKGWAIVIGGAILLLALLIGVIALIVHAVGGSDEPEKNAVISTETTEETLSPEERIPDILKRADFVAAGYDYDAAITILQEFGADWKEQPELSAANDRYLAEKAKLVRYEDTTQITHIFFHSLIVDTDRAFDGDSKETGYNQYMATVTEFNRILEELYKRNFVLIRIHDIVKVEKDENGKDVYKQGDIWLPPGKQPIVISQDDVNYYEYMVDGDGDRFPDAGGDGFANRIVIGEDGYPTCEYYAADGQKLLGDYDMAPILEHFVQEHPDFSYRGARGILALTGYEGVFGYKTHPQWKDILGEEAYNEEVRKAAEVTQCLKDHGWEIACHSYAHFGYGYNSAEDILADVNKWEDQVQPIVGDTDIFIYPYGSDIAGIEAYEGAKYEAMYQAGYRFFCNVDGSTPYWVQIRDDYVRQGRRNIDGYRMYWGPELLDDLFDVDEIWDKARPATVPSIV